MLFQYVPELAAVQEAIVDCFAHGGGVPYSSYPRFQALRAEETARVFEASLLQTTLRLVDGLTEELEAGISVCDAGCGQGYALLLMARRLPKSRFTGYDLSEEAITAARGAAQQEGLSNLRFEVGDVTTLSPSARFGLVISFDCIHDLPRPTETLRAIASALEKNGRFLMVDIAAHSELAENLEHLLGPALYGISCLHCVSVSLAQGGVGLRNMRGEQKARQMPADAGLASVQVRRVHGDPITSYFIATRGEV